MIYLWRLLVIITSPIWGLLVGLSAVAWIIARSFYRDSLFPIIAYLRTGQMKEWAVENYSEARARAMRERPNSRDMP